MSRIRVLILHGHSLDEDISHIENIVNFLKNSGTYVPVMAYLGSEPDKSTFSFILRSYYMFIYGSVFAQLKDYCDMKPLSEILNKE